MFRHGVSLTIDTLPTGAAASALHPPVRHHNPTAQWAGMRLLHTTLPSWADVTIPVPSMGESITEGTIATVLKKPGVYC